MNEEKINKFIEAEMDDGLGVQFINGERFFGLEYKYDGGLLVFDKTQQIIDDCDWWDVIPMNDIQIIQLLNELYEKNEELKYKNFMLSGASRILSHELYVQDSLQKSFEALEMHDRDIQEWLMKEWKEWEKQNK